MTSPAESASSPDRRAVVAIAAVLVVVLVVVVVTFVGGDDDGSSDASQATSTSVSTSVVTPVGLLGAPIESELPWPEPPTDHDPHVIVSAGGGPLVDDAEGLALVYVNSIGRATFLDLATGDRTEIEVSRARYHDRIALEPTGVRSLIERRNVQLAGPGAIVVHLHQPTLLAGWTGEAEPGLHLCLSTSCIARNQYERLVDDPERPEPTALSIDPLDGAARPDIAALVLGDAPISGRFRVVETPAGQTRVPSPIGGSIWVVTATGTGRAVAGV